MRLIYDIFARRAATPFRRPADAAPVPRATPEARVPHVYTLPSGNVQVVLKVGGSLIRHEYVRRGQLVYELPDVGGKVPVSPDLQPTRVGPQLMVRGSEDLEDAVRRALDEREGCKPSLLDAIDGGAAHLGIGAIAFGVFAVIAVCLAVVLFFGQLLWQGETSAAIYISMAGAVIFACCFGLRWLWRDSPEQRMAIIFAGITAVLAAGWMLPQPFNVLG